MRLQNWGATRVVSDLIQELGSERDSKLGGDECDASLSESILAVELLDFPFPAVEI